MCSLDKADMATIAGDRAIELRSGHRPSEHCCYWEDVVGCGIVDIETKLFDNDI